MGRRRNRKKCGFLSRLSLALYLVAGIALLISYLSPYINPAGFWPVAFFGLAYPFLVLLNLLFLVFWLFRGSKRSLIPLLLLLAGLPFHVQHFGFRFQPDKPQRDSTLTIMSYNSHSFSRYGKNFSETKKSGMLAVIKEASPDIIAIQEFYTRPEGPFDIKDSLKHILGTDYYFIEVVERNDFETRGLAIFSRYPIENREAIHFKEHKSYNSCIYADITVRGQKIRLFNLHLQSISFQPEDYRYLSRVKDQLEPDMSSSRRIGGRLKRAFVARAGQAEIVAGLVRESPHPVVVCGDFNDTPMSYAYRTIRKEGLQSAFREKGSGYSITYAGAFPSFQIDHILCDENFFEVLDYRIMKKKLSDHYPISSTLELKTSN